MKTKKCQCELCVKWHPMQKRILKKLRGRDRRLFEEFLWMEMQQSDNLGAAEAKLAGEWPGYEKMKTFRPEG